MVMVARRRSWLAPRRLSRAPLFPTPLPGVLASAMASARFQIGRRSRSGCCSEGSSVQRGRGQGRLPVHGGEMQHNVDSYTEF